MMDLFILMAVAHGPLHGYAAIQAVRERSGGAVRVGTGSFYRRLSILMKNRLVEEAAAPPDDDPRRGAYYRITAAGRRVLQAERERLAALVVALDGLRPSSRRGRA